ncbi:DUF2397 family protein, partial [Streptomyces sp. NPDC001939]
MDTTLRTPGDGPDGYGPFAHLTAPNAPLYRSVMRSFLVAKERFAVHLRPEDVHAGLPATARPTTVTLPAARHTGIRTVHIPRRALRPGFLRALRARCRGDAPHRGPRMRF